MSLSFFWIADQAFMIIVLVWYISLPLILFSLYSLYKDIGRTDQSKYIISWKMILDLLIIAAIPFFIAFLGHIFKESNQLTAAVLSRAILLILILQGLYGLYLFTKFKKYRAFIITYTLLFLTYSFSVASISMMFITEALL